MCACVKDIGVAKGSFISLVSHCSFYIFSFWYHGGGRSEVKLVIFNVLFFAIELLSLLLS